MPNEDKLVGEEMFSVGSGDPFASDLITAEPVEIETQEDVSKLVAPKVAVETPTKTEPKQEKRETQAQTSQDKKEEPQVKKGNAAAVLAESFKKDGILPDDFVPADDFSAKALKKILIETAQKEAEELVRAEYEQKFSAEALRTADLIAKGVNPEDISEINFYKRLSNASTDDVDDDQSIRIKEFVIKEMYKDKGLKESKIDKLVQEAFDEDEAEEEFAEAKKYFSDKAKGAETQIQAENDRLAAEEKSKQEDLNRQIKSLIKSGEIYNTSDEKTKKELEAFLFDQSETLKIDGKLFKVTPYQKALKEYDSDLKKQLNFAKLLMSGFDLGAIEELGKASKADELDELLEAMPSEGTDSKKNNKSFGFLEDPTLQELF